MKKIALVYNSIFQGVEHTLLVLDFLVHTHKIYDLEEITWSNRTGNQEGGFFFFVIESSFNAIETESVLVCKFWL